MIIAFINLKGGIGKTTAVVTLAQLWREQNPLIIDTDEQHATGIFELNGIERIETTPQAAESFLSVAQGRLVLVDCPGLIGVSAPILQAAHAVLLPVQCELLALDATNQAIQAIRQEYSPLRLRGFLTMNKQDAHSRQVRDEARALWPNGLFESVIPFRRAVSLASLEGQTVMDYAPQSDAAKQYKKLAGEIQQWLYETE